MPPETRQSHDPATESQKPDLWQRLGKQVSLDSLSWTHWIIVVASLVMTIAAWNLSTRQVQEKAATRFDRETARIVELVLERMQRYEDALWAGTAFIHSLGGDVDFETWRTYANAISIEQKYPGINGMGVIHYVAPDQLDTYLETQRQQRPDYNIKPAHDENEYWPISYIVPVAPNQEAVGLDMAHEQNRFTASKLARDTGQANITGPIVLVQDAQRTPGFLFFAPFYHSDPPPESLEERRETFVGMVYAPFVVRKLVDGVLARERRDISFSLHDEDYEIYTENLDHQESYDEDPLFESTIPVELYGRTWRFDFRSTLSFRKATSNLQPTTILVGGITIDLLLLFLFVHISRSNHSARQQTDSLKRLSERLEQANEELSQFNYRTSHDLVAPLKTIRGYVDLAVDDLKHGNTDSVREALERISRQSSRLEELVHDLLNLCRVDRLEPEFEEIDFNALFEATKQSLVHIVEEHDVSLNFSVNLSRPLLSQEVRIAQILENLVSNSVKYSDPQKDRRWVEVRVADAADKRVRIEVEDNGIGIPSHVKDRIFEIFYRVGDKREYGSGLGSYLVKKHVDHLSGRIEYQSTPEGTCFRVDIPNRA